MACGAESPVLPRDARLSTLPPCSWSVPDDLHLSAVLLTPSQVFDSWCPLVCCRHSWSARTAARGTWCSASTSPPWSRAHPRCPNTPLKKKSRVSTRPSVSASDHTAAADATPLTTHCHQAEGFRTRSRGSCRGTGPGNRAGQRQFALPCIPACGLGFLLASHRLRLERGKKWRERLGPWVLVTAQHTLKPALRQIT